MNPLEKLLAKLELLDEQIGAILAHDEPTAEQLAEHDKLVAQREKLMEQVKRAQAQANRMAERDQAIATLAADKTREQRRPVRVADADDPHGFKIPANATIEVVEAPKYVERRLRNGRTRRLMTRGFREHREFLECVMAAGLGHHIDPRLRPITGLSDEQIRRVMTAGSDEARGISDPAGGFLVPEAFLPEFLMAEPEDDPFGALTTKVPMSLPIVKIPARTDKNHTTSVSGGLTVTRRPETVAGTSSQMTMEQVLLSATTLFGLSYATEELLTDSPISFLAILEQGFKQQFTYQLINERISGVGVGEFEGVLNSPALITIAKESGQAASTIILENIVKVRAQVWGYQRGVWIANHDTVPQLSLLNQAVGVAGTGMVWVPSFREDVPDLLMGRPIMYSEYAPALGTAGQIMCIVPSEYLEGLYQPLQSAESIHVRFVNHERAFKFWMRNDGRGWWKSVLTPRNSSKTLSPFVQLAA